MITAERFIHSYLFTVLILEFSILTLESHEFGGTHRSKISRIAEKHKPLVSKNIFAFLVIFQFFHGKPLSYEGSRRAVSFIEEESK